LSIESKTDKFGVGFSVRFFEDITDKEKWKGRRKSELRTEKKLIGSAVLRCRHSRMRHRPASAAALPRSALALAPQL
jgi:hypothetical protein